MFVSIVVKPWHLMEAGTELYILPAVCNYACDNR